MKKILLSAAMMVAAVSFASAQQWFVGGALGIGSSKTEDPLNNQETKVTSFDILPKVGYEFNDKWAVALQIGYGSEITKINLMEQTDPVTAEEKETTSAFIVNPYVRYTAWELGRFSLAFQGDVLASFGSMEIEGVDAKPKTTTIGVGIAPVVQFDLTDAVMLEARLNFAGINFNSTTIDPDVDGAEKSKNNSFNFGVDTDDAFTTGALQVGFIVKF